MKSYILATNALGIETTELNLRKIAESSQCTFCVSDIQKTQNFSRNDIFFPFTTTQDSKILTSSPIFGNDTLSSLYKESDSVLLPMARELPRRTLTKIDKLSTETIEKSIYVCCNGDAITGQKRQWYLENSKKYFGYIGLFSDVPKVILEFMRSSDCPFPIVPSSKNSLFIMCLYSNDENFDYIKHLFEHFIEESIQQALTKFL